MRPVRLELDGFGPFRQPSTVDFADADFFALVGPTGAGKSTVVDAIVFALYGSVPRWDDRRGVGWGLAPTAGRGVVTLTFDAGPDRYVAARELRRSAQGKVTVKNARLERVPPDRWSGPVARRRRGGGAAPVRAGQGHSEERPTGAGRRRRVDGAGGRGRRGERRGREAARALVRPLRPVRDPAAGGLRPVPALQPEGAAGTPGRPAR